LESRSIRERTFIEHQVVELKFLHESALKGGISLNEVTFPPHRTIQDLKEHVQGCVRFGTDFVSRSNPEPYINAEVFLDYSGTVFLPNLAEPRALDAFTEETGMLLMDNCPSHVTDYIIGLLTEARVRVITFAPHTAQIFQVLDVTLFGVLRRRPGSKLPLEDEKESVKFIMKVYHNFKQTMVEFNTWEAFQVIGFEFDTGAEPYRLLSNEEKLRQSEGFRELWSIDFPLDQLSSQRQNFRFGWINKHE
jgi:hypothetical protein